MKLISGFFTPLVLIALSASSSADQCISDLNSCMNDRENLEEKVVRLESEIERKNEKIETLDTSLETCQNKLALTTSTTLAPTTTTLEPCGTFAPFDATSPAGLQDLVTNGFSAGTYLNNNEAYIGKGTKTSSCSYESPYPGRISANPSNPGIYMGCSSTYFYKNGIFYLRNHPNLAWISTNSIDMMAISNPLKFGPYNHFVGRIVLNGTTYVGKVWAHSAANYGPGLYYTTDTKEIFPITTGFDILTC